MIANHNQFDMLTRMFVGIFGVLLLGLTACQSETNTMNENKGSAMYQKTDIPTPVAAKVPKELTIHEHTRTDNYYWLNERENEDVISYLEAENAYKDEMMDHTKDFQDKLFEEMKGRVKEDDQSVPYKDNGYFYITRYEEGSEYPIYSRKEGSLEAEEEIMLNVNELATDFNYYRVGGRSVSPRNEN